MEWRKQAVLDICATPMIYQSALKFELSIYQKPFSTVLWIDNYGWRSWVLEFYALYEFES